MVRSIASVLVGYVVMSTLSVLRLGIINQNFPRVFPEADSFPSTGWVVLFLFSDFVFAVIGGFTTATIAIEEKEKHVIALAIMVLVMGVASVATMPDTQPAWYKIVLILLGLAGVRIGGNLAIRRRASVLPS